MCRQEIERGDSVEMRSRRKPPREGWNGTRLEGLGVGRDEVGTVGA